MKHLSIFLLLFSFISISALATPPEGESTPDDSQYESLEPFLKFIQKEAKCGDDAGAKGRIEKCCSLEAKDLDHFRMSPTKSVKNCSEQLELQDQFKPSDKATKDAGKARTEEKTKDGKPARRASIIKEFLKEEKKPKAKEEKRKRKRKSGDRSSTSAATPKSTSTGYNQEFIKRVLCPAGKVSQAIYQPQFKTSEGSNPVTKPRFTCQKDSEKEETHGHQYDAQYFEDATGMKFEEYAKLPKAYKPKAVETRAKTKRKAQVKKKDLDCAGKALNAITNRKKPPYPTEETCKRRLRHLILQMMR